MLRVNERADGVTIECRVTPRAGKSRVKGVQEGVLLVALAAPPVDDAANKELIDLISRKLGIPKSRISIARGARGRTKILLIRGLDPTGIADVFHN